MAGGKETPRQRMIGILYLVLLGLIALSVPDSLLDAFKNITNSLDQSRANVTESLNDTYKAFEANKLKQEGERAQKILTEARKASAITEDLDKYIEEVKAELIKEGGGINPEINDVDARDNLDISPRLMVDGKKADVLREKIDATREGLLALLGKDRNGVNFSLNTSDPLQKPGSVKKNWQEGYFGNGIPLGAALTTLAKIQADNKNAENEVVKKILGKVDKAEINLDQFKAVVVAPSSYIIAGQPYTAEVFLTAYDKNATPTITVDGRSVPVSNGTGKFTSTYGEGVHKFRASVSVRGTDGQIKTYMSDEQSLTVARPSATISPTKMNVLYIGVENPLSISAPGVPVGSIRASISGAGGDLSGSGGGYSATVRSIGTAKITVSDDKGHVLGAMDFRTKRIPPPKAQFAGKNGGSISAANARAQDRLFAVLEGFDFAAKYSITRFQMYVAKRGQDLIQKTNTGAELSGDVKALLNTVTPGSLIYFEGIIAVGPDGIQQEIDPIAIKVN
ncbi:type IX secretion system motor protein PorM/GldM [Mucilaginibacter myungsuensis]|uniref:Gliding motility protein GldM n=1 Tax=Mucilaginibacter myungsuensis TaxID=649104 RepID=A0A929L4P3_9SPHI|nr:gliding motility protein GldM [Mucilaginibacter myungsuensis]MBE9663960.1 gliding motility protein GldM [Mucilaginibacter myungsuensis]MDN3598324.1 gliding motility protein GldM [Mucilaginibacter myungsuensis]